MWVQFFFPFFLTENGRKSSQVQAREHTVTSKIFEIIVFDWIFCEVFQQHCYRYEFRRKMNFDLIIEYEHSLWKCYRPMPCHQQILKVWAIWIEFHAITRKSALSENWLHKLCILLTLFLHWQWNASIVDDLVKEFIARQKYHKNIISIMHMSNSTQNKWKPINYADGHVRRKHMQH